MPNFEHKGRTLILPLLLYRKYSSTSCLDFSVLLTASHGDDLLYLFELQTLEGKAVPEAALNDSKDLKVKEVFVNVVSNFVKDGCVYVAVN